MAICDKCKKILEPNNQDEGMIQNYISFKVEREAFNLCIDCWQDVLLLIRGEKWAKNNFNNLYEIAED